MRSTLLILLLSAASSQAAGWLDWSASQAQSIGKSTFQPARIGGGRVLLNTERARSYKLGVTWLTPDVIRASIRLHQLSRRLDDPSAEALATEALKRRDLVFMVDIDPDEGSGVIPLDWQALIRVVSPSVQVPPLAGTKAASLRGDPAFAGVLRRNYDY